WKPKRRNRWHKFNVRGAGVVDRRSMNEIISTSVARFATESPASQRRGLTTTGPAVSVVISPATTGEKLAEHAGATTIAPTKSGFVSRATVASYDKKPLQSRANRVIRVPVGREENGRREPRRNRDGNCRFRDPHSGSSCGGSRCHRRKQFGFRRWRTGMDSPPQDLGVRQFDSSGTERFGGVSNSRRLGSETTCFAI